MKKIIGFGIIILISILLTAGCNFSAEPLMKKEKVTDIHIEKNTEKQFVANLHINYGNVFITGGAKDLVNGEITYNVNKLKPKVKFKSKRNKGKLSIDQTKKGGINLSKGSLKNNWDLQLTNDIPIDLKVSTGAAKTYMDLQGTQLEKLDIETGVGDTTVDLGGDWQDSFDVDIEMGVGQTTMILPKGIGVKIKAEKGIGITNVEGLISEGDGIYVNKAYNNTDVTININAEIGVGEANFKLED